MLSLSSLIRACGHGGEWRTAEKLFSDMQGLGIEPNAVTYNALMGALELGDQWEAVLRVWEQMLHNGIRPDPVTYPILARAKSRARLAGSA